MVTGKWTTLFMWRWRNVLKLLRTFANSSVLRRSSDIRHVTWFRIFDAQISIIRCTNLLYATCK
ncbi:hypothetical protein Ccrd_001263, partial [Cynara cardunculus var. scolymus]